MKRCDNDPEMKEIHKPGVYFLFGKDDESDRKFVYVGESDNALRRILQPHSFENGDCYWTEVVILVTPDETLDKAKIKYTTVIATENKELAIKLDIKQAPTLVVINGDSIEKIVNVSNIRAFAEKNSK